MGDSAAAAQAKHIMMPTCRLEVHESALQMTKGNIAGLEAVLNLHPDPRVSLCMTVMLSLVCRA